jgi:hypothetical protein
VPLRAVTLAERCGVPAAEIHDLEAGRMEEPELIVGLRLAEALSIDAWLLASGPRVPTSDPKFKESASRLPLKK